MADRKYLPNEAVGIIDEILRRNSTLEKRIRDLERRVANQDSPQPLPRIDPTTYPAPFEGQRAIDITDEQHTWYSDGEWRKAGGGVGLYEIKVFEDPVVVAVGDMAFDWPIPRDLDGSKVVWVEAGVSTVASSGTTQVQIRKVGVGDLLTTKISIDAGEKNSKDAATQPVIDTGTISDLAWGDHLAIDVDSAGVGAKGLAVIVGVAPSALASVVLEGSKGDPGGITSWTGVWSNTTTYVIGEAVSNGGTSYVAIAGSTDVEPGVDAGWQNYWMVLVESHQVSEIAVAISGSGYVLDTGIKVRIPIYFPGTIVEATLLADATGSVVVDIWKDTYGNYPPTDADSITAAAPLTLSGAIKTTDTTLTGWTTAIASGDTLIYNIDSCSGIRDLTVGLKIRRT